MLSLLKTFGLALVLAFVSAGTARAHFLSIIPSQSSVTARDQANVVIDLAFAHPMAQQGLEMARPQSFRVFANGGETDLLPGLKEKEVLGHKAWTAAYKVSRPGVYQFVVVQEPYFEPAEDTVIIHCAKTVIGAYGEEDGWGEPLGLRAEIVPLTRPFANYAGNVFTGRVLVDGKPAPGVEVEVECWNSGQGRRVDNEYFTTQVVRADENGVFTYGVPWPGWWGFAALTRATDKMEYDGKPRDVEIGAVIWARFVEPSIK